jgi:hypothetical protein
MARRSRPPGGYLSGNILDGAGPGTILDPLPKKRPPSLELIHWIDIAAQALQRNEELQAQVVLLQRIVNRQLLVQTVVVGQ